MVQIENKRRKKKEEILADMKKKNENVRNMNDRSSEIKRKKIWRNSHSFHKCRTILKNEKKKESIQGERKNKGEWRIKTDFSEHERNKNVEGTVDKKSIKV